MKKILAAVLSIALLSGCTAVQWAKDNPESAVLAVKSGTLAFVEQVDPVQRRVERAEEVIVVVNFILSQMDSSTSATVSTLTSSVKSQIDWNSLDAYERLLLDSLIYSIQQRLEDRVGSGILEDEDKVVVKQVLVWAKSAAEVYADKEG
jgi:PBP1b-binding outer membrane lipoprotein LpoB